MGFLNKLFGSKQPSADDECILKLCLEAENLLRGGEAYFQRGDHQSAFQTFRQLMTKVAEINTTLQSTTAISTPTVRQTKSLKKAIVERFTYYHDKGVEASNSKDYEKAAFYLGAAVALEIRTFIAAFKLAEVFLFTKEHDQAREVLNGILSSDPGNSKAHREIGWTYLSQENYHDALGHLQKAIQLEPKDGTAHYFIAICYAGLGQNLNAKEHAAKSRSLGVEKTYEKTFRENLSFLGI
jgi:tetratricopeptide (TPR) repeat protein